MERMGKMKMVVTNVLKKCKSCTPFYFYGNVTMPTEMNCNWQWNVKLNLMRRKLKRSWTNSFLNHLIYISYVYVRFSSLYMFISIHVTPCPEDLFFHTLYFSDRLRTIANVMPTLYGSVLINKLCKRDLPDTSDYSADICRTVSLPEEMAKN